MMQKRGAVRRIEGRVISFSGKDDGAMKRWPKGRQDSMSYLQAHEPCTGCLLWAKWMYVGLTWGFIRRKA